MERGQTNGDDKRAVTTTVHLVGQVELGPLVPAVVVPAQGLQTVRGLGAQRALLVEVC